MLPVFVRNEYRLRFVYPFLAVPLQTADCVRSPETRGAARIVDALHPGFLLRVPSLHIGRAVTAALQIPCPTALVPGQKGDAGGVAGLGCQRPSPSGERSSGGE